MKNNFKNVKNNSLLGHVFFATVIITLVALMVVILRGWQINNSVKDEQKYRPNKSIDVVSQLIAGVGIENLTSIPLDDKLPSYGEGYNKLKECGQFSVFERMTGNSVDQYNDLINKGNAINQSLLNLNKVNFLNYTYQIDFNTLLQTSCDNSIDSTIHAIDKYLRDTNQLKALNWSEKNQRHFKTNQTIFASIPNNWNTIYDPWRGIDGCVYIENLNPQLTYDNQHDTKEPLPISLVALESDNESRNSLCRSKAVYKSAESTLDIEDPDSQIINVYTYNDDIANDLMSFNHLLNGVTQIHPESDPFTIDYQGVNVPIGFSAKLSINPEIQRITQTLANCATASETQDTNCTSLMSSKMIADANSFEDQALSRMLGIAVIDVQTKGIDALVGANSPCFQANYISNSNIDCIPVPDTWGSSFTPSSVLHNHAIYTEYMPGSTIKPIQALAIARAFPDLFESGSNSEKSLKKIMAKSYTESVIDVLACQSLSTNYQSNCQGFSQVITAANDLGWNQQCDGVSSNCGYGDILRGKPLGSTAVDEGVFFGRLMQTEQNGIYSPISGLSNLTDSDYKRRKADNTTWRGGEGRNTTVDYSINEFYGQGNARTTPIGLAIAITNLLSADNNSLNTPVHLLSELWAANQNDVSIANRDSDEAVLESSSSGFKSFFVNLFSRDTSQTIELNNHTQSKSSVLDDDEVIKPSVSFEEAHNATSLFTQGHYIYPEPYINKKGESKTRSVIGTSYEPCKEVFGTCEQYVQGYKLFTKTGTPSFNYRNIHNASENCSLVKREDGTIIKREWTCNRRPIKWHVLGIGEQNGQWSKVIVVMAERNWKLDGSIDDITDSNNVAARVSLSLMKQLDLNGLIN